MFEYLVAAAIGAVVWELGKKAAVAAYAKFVTKEAKKFDGASKPSDPSKPSA